MPFRNAIVAGVELIREAIQSRNFVTGVSGWRIARDGTAEFLNVIIRGLIEASNIEAGPLPNFTVEGATGIVTFQGAIKKIQIVPTGTITGTPEIRFYSEDESTYAYINQDSTVDSQASISVNSSPFTPADAVERRARLFLSPLSERLRLEIIEDNTNNPRGGAVEATYNALFLEHTNGSGNTRFIQIDDNGISLANADVVTGSSFEFQVAGTLFLPDGSTVVLGDTTTPAVMRQAQDTGFVSTSSASFVALGGGTGTPGTTFIAPPSGEVKVTIKCSCVAAAAGTAHSLAAFEVREGGTIGSGTVVHAANDDDRVDLNAINTVAHTGSSLTLVNGLTPGNTYNARMMYRRVSGGVAAGFAVRRIIIEPAIVASA